MEIDFSENPRVLVGVNESGKTNILHALRLLGNFDPKNDDIRETSKPELIRESKILFIFTLNEKELKNIFEKVKGKILMRDFDKNIVFEGGFSYNLRALIEKKYYESIYSIDLVRKIKTLTHWSFNGLKISNTFKKVKPDINYTFQDPKLGVLNLSAFDFLDSEDFKDIPSDYFDDTAGYEKLEILIGRCQNEVVQNSLPKVIFWEYKDEHLLPPSIPLDTFVNNPNSCIPLKNLFIIANIPEDQISPHLQQFRNDFNRLQSRLDKVANEATKFFRKSWPEYKNIKFNLQLTETSIKCNVQELNKWDFQKRSDGFRRFIALLLHLVIPAEREMLNNTLILIDDAEISLHPKGCCYLLEQLKKLAKNNYVIYATHSIFMIDTENIKRHYIVEKTNEITKIKEATEENYIDEEVLYQALGASVYEVLKNKNILFEGWCDKKLFEVFVSSNKNYHRVFKNIGIGHSNGVKSIKNILSILEMGKRKCLIITDNENVAKQYQKEWQENNGWGIWKRYNELCRRDIVTCEDFIKQQFLKIKLKRVLEEININLNIDKIELPDRGRLSSIENKLKENGLESEKIREIIKKLKEEIFNNLKYNEIENDYTEVVEEIKKQIESL
ncbi:MAG: ATP-binding protein [Candidatus Omnitrophica bacterium]|nr:ATP-binding protein [Candidatus Omnitrophota bacterium]